MREASRTAVCRSGAVLHVVLQGDSESMPHSPHLGVSGCLMARSLEAKCAVTYWRVPMALPPQLWDAITRARFESVPRHRYSIGTVCY